MINSFSDKVFAKVHGSNLVYNTCWEDPRLDREALKLTNTSTTESNISDHRVAVITSAGCNALDYLLAGARSVLAIDINFRQNALLQLKVAALKVLSYEEFFALFGRGLLPDFDNVLRTRLKSELSNDAYQYFLDHQAFFTGKSRYLKRASTFYFRGTSGFFARLINIYIDRIANLRRELGELFQARDLKEQRNQYDEEIEPRFWKPYVRWFMQRDTTLSLLGVPKAQRVQVDKFYPGGIGSFIYDSVKAVFRDLPLVDNYFWRVYLQGEYTPTCCPEYLKEENFTKLSSRLNDEDSLKCITAPLHEGLKSYKEEISRFVLLDHMDWLHHARRDILQLEWEEIFRKAAKDSIAIFRSGGLKVDFLDDITVTSHGKRVTLKETLKYDEDLSARLHAKDRVHTYGSFYIASLTTV
jgi:S-adenosylmethionine-diacylglycerol 3-amino-3-carboxypropyl transferase